MNMNSRLAALGATPLLAGLAALAGAPAASAAGAQLDVGKVGARAAALEVTATSAYSFVVDPDVQSPRASAGIAAGQSTAAASPADPGDNADALAGVIVPMAEQSAIAQLRQGAQQAPPPLSTVLNTAADTAATVVQVTSPVNKALSVPFEHVDASYPDPQHPGARSATFGPDPSFADPTGNLAVDGAIGRVLADNGTAIADAGGGLAVATPAGVRIGRVSSHAETHSTAQRVVSDAVSEVDGIDLAPQAFAGVPLPPLPPGVAVLHIGAVTTTLHSERLAGAAAATSTSHVEITGVTVAGQQATIDEKGIHAGPASASAQPVVDALNTAWVDVAHAANGVVPPGTPFGGHPVLPLGHIGGPAVTPAPARTPDSTGQTAIGLSLTVAGTVLVPGSTAVPPVGGPPAPVPQAVLLTLNLATAHTDAYGKSLPVAAPVPVPVTGSGGSGHPVGGTGGIAGSAGTQGTSGTADGGPADASRSIPLHRIAVALGGPAIPRPLVVALAALAEALMLGALVARYRAGTRVGAPAEPAGPGPEDLV